MNGMKSAKRKQINSVHSKQTVYGMVMVETWRGEWIVVKQSTDKFYFVWHQKLNYNNFLYIFRHLDRIKWNGFSFVERFFAA